MNTQAANGLLKALEEPPQHVVSYSLPMRATNSCLPLKAVAARWCYPPPTHEQAAAYLRQQGVENAEALLAFHSGAPLFTPTPELDALREELLTLLAAPRLLAILDYAAAFDKQKQPLAVFHQLAAKSG